MSLKRLMTGAGVLALAMSAVAGNESLVHYAVPAMSDVKRLADTPVTDGVKGGTVKIILAKDEYEPGSFVLEPSADLGRVELKLSAFVNEKGEALPADAFDLKVVKIWYQNGNSWNNYFGDTGFTLCPELLLNDENLIRVDTSKTANYARITAKDGSVSERWINPPRQLDLTFWDSRYGQGFACMKPGFEDAPTFQPVELKAGERKQFFLTVHSTKAMKAGVYRGAVEVIAGKDSKRTTASVPSPAARIPVAVRILDFVLPAPATYKDETRLMNISFYTHDSIDECAWLNGGDRELAERQYAAIMKNRVAHGQTISHYQWLGNPDCDKRRKAMREAGMRDVAVGLAPFKDSGFDVELEGVARRSYAYVTNYFGHSDIFDVYGDETGLNQLRDNRKFLHAMRKAGFKFFLANTSKLFRNNAADYADGWVSYSDAPEDRQMGDEWNSLPNGTSIGWYAQQHVASENPAFCRRQYGLTPYLAGYTALSNYAHYNRPYNDDSTTYRPMCFTYVDAKGCIDTIQWEGFREGIDDMRYATKLVTLARKAALSKDVIRRDAGIHALQCLITFDRSAGDLAAIRREMTSHILNLIALEK